MNPLACQVLLVCVAVSAVQHFENGLKGIRSLVLMAFVNTAEDHIKYILK